MLQPPQRLARIGRNHVNDLVKPAGRPILRIVGAGHLDAKSRSHGEIVHRSFHQLFKLAREFVTLFG